MSERRSLLRFHVRDIREGEGLQASLDVPPELLFPEPPTDARGGGAPCRLSGPVAVGIELSLGGSRILMQARLEGEWKLRCSRCLAEHFRRFAADAEETYPAEEDVIDLTEELRQTVLLELPQRSLCRPDCKGFCPQCGAALNEGACGCVPERPKPFEALKKLKQDRGN